MASDTRSGRKEKRKVEARRSSVSPSGGRKWRFDREAADEKFHNRAKKIRVEKAAGAHKYGICNREHR